MSNPSLYATFIGIDAYAQFPLSGCVKDVLDIDLLLRELVAQQSDMQYKPLYFLAPGQTGTRKLNEYQTARQITLDIKRPTFEAVTKDAFAHLKQADNGDICLLYYSGHGSQTDAPEIFWHNNPDRQNETIVCVDSRDAASPNSRDIIDKEMAFLLWDALKGKDVHCLVIMDCCHAANNTRAALEEIDNGVRNRFISSAKNNIPIDQYIGYTSGFYQVKDGKASFDIAKYVHLAAARASEKAQETASGGLFTSNLVEVLRQGGTAKSYRELMQTLAITIRNRASSQNPVAYARDDQDLDLKFMGTGIKPYEPSFEVRYDFAAKKWIMYGGAMHNITPSTANAKTLVRIPGLDHEVAITEVDVSTSVLDANDMLPLAKDKETYQAIIVSMANAPVEIGLSAKLLSEPELLASLQEAYSQAKHLFFSIDFDNKTKNSDYNIQLTDDKAYILTKNNSDVPLFQREWDALSFLKNTDVVCKWVRVSELKNSNTKFTKDDFIFKLEKIEGKFFSRENVKEWENYKGQIMYPEPVKETVFRYQGKMQPAFRLSVELKNPAIESLYIGALYLDSRYGIVHDLIKSDKGSLLKGGSPINLSWTFEENEEITILLTLPQGYSQYNVNEITEFLKIFVSTEPVNLDQYKQQSLTLDIRKSEDDKKSRGVGFDTPDADGNAREKADWTVFTFPFRIEGPDKSKKLQNGDTITFSSFSIQAPKQFTATAFAATGNDQQRKLNTVTRGADKDADLLYQAIMPPPGIWGDVISDECSFARGMSAASDNGIQVLELLPVKENEELTLAEHDEIIISPVQAEAVRAINDDGLQETIIPYGFDEQSQLFYPLGVSDAQGNIHIIKLPPPTPGRLINTDEKLSRSLGSSVKLFFKKIFKRNNANTLALYELNAGQPWKRITEDTNEIKSVLEKDKTATVVLMIHGIIGDTKSIVESMMEFSPISAAVKYVLTYDYENLSTPIEKTAEMLNDSLSKAGFNADRKLCIIAHSMGGLVTRWLVEKKGGNAYVNEVIFAGTPNAGSEIAGLKNSVLGLITHALNVTGPIKYALTGLSFLLKKLELDPGATLSEMTPGSGFLTGLSNDTTPDNIPYYVIGGDTSLLKQGYNGNDFFLKKIAEALKDDVVYPGLTGFIFNHKPNDIAVSLESMQSIHGFNSTHMHVLATDHMSYFTENCSRQKLLELLSCKSAVPAL